MLKMNYDPPRYVNPDDVRQMQDEERRKVAEYFRKIGFQPNQQQPPSVPPSQFQQQPQPPDQPPD